MGRLDDEEKKPEQEEEKFDLFRHFSHEHPLQLSFNTSEPSEVICAGCGMTVIPTKSYYACQTCCFSLHTACYNMPRKVHHPADPGHDLILLLLPSFACKACGKPGSGFAYNCPVCHQNYHSLCTVLPLSASHCSHPHVLNLRFSSPYDGIKGFRCDICTNLGYDHWMYRCGPCEFDAHLNCAFSNQPAQHQMKMVLSDDNCYNQKSRTINSNWVQQNQQTYVLPASGQQGVNRPLYYVQPGGNGPAPMAQPQGYPGYYYGNQNMVVNGQNHGGMKPLIVGSVGSGMGQAIGQEMVHSLISGWGTGLGDSDMVSCWFGDGAKLL